MMRKFGIRCGFAVVCAVTVLGGPARSQDVPSESPVEKKPVAEKSEAQAPAESPSPEETTAQEKNEPAPSAETAVAEASAEEAPEAPPVESGEAASASSPAAEIPAAAGETSTEPASAPSERVPEAVEADPNRLSAHVGIQPSEAPQQVTSDGEKRVLLGTWTKSILFATDDKSFRFQPRGWVQPRFDLVVNSNSDYNNDEPLDGTGFSLLRARFGFQAWLFKWARFYLDTEWKSGTPSMVDYFVDLGPNNGDGVANVRVGYFRPFFVRQILNGTTQLSLIDYARAWTALDFVPSSDGTSTGYDYTPVPLNGRQLGIAVQGLVLNGLEYGVGIWNGSDGYAKDADFMYGGRLAVHPMGLAGGATARPGDETDSCISPSPVLSLGLSAYIEDRNDARVDIPVIPPYEDFKLRTGFDAVFKIAGVALTGEVFVLHSWAKQGVINDTREMYNRDAPGVGGYFQVAYMVVPKRVEVAARFDTADENVAIRGIRFYPTAGLTYFLFGNNLKTQFQYRANVGAGYHEVDPLYTPVSHDVIFLIQASI